MGHLDDTGFAVETVSLDHLVATSQIKAPNFMKIDIEGGEVAALVGARNTILQSHPTIFLATHGPKVHSECCDYLLSMGYLLQPVDGDSIDLTDEVLATWTSH